LTFAEDCIRYFTSDEGTRNANRDVGDQPKTRPLYNLRSEPTDNTANNQNDTNKFNLYFHEPLHVVYECDANIAMRCISFGLLAALVQPLTNCPQEFHYITSWNLQIRHRRYFCFRENHAACSHC